MKTTIKKHVSVFFLVPAVLFAWSASAYACEDAGSTPASCEIQCSLKYPPGTDLYIGCMIGATHHQKANNGDARATK